MAQGNSIHDEIKAQNKKMKEMSFSEKCSHIWEYYKFPILGTLIGIAAVIAVVVMVVRNNYERSFYCVVVDGRIKGFEDHTDYLTTNFTEYLGLDGKSQRVIFDNNYTFIQQPMDYDPYYSVEKIFTMATAKTLDGCLVEQRYIRSFCMDEELFFEDLRDCLTPQELEALSDRLIYYKDKEGNETPIGVNMTDSKIKTIAGLTMEAPCYGVVSTSEHKDNAIAFIRFIFDLP